jgi:hypothetical protein
MRYILSITLLFFIVGCVPYSDTPLTDAGKQEMDSSIYGTWFWNEKNESGYVHIGMDKESNLLKVMMLSFQSDGKLDVSEFAGHTSCLENNRYLNLKWIRPTDENPGYLFVKYEVSDAVLKISIIDADPVEKAIKDGVLKGELNDGNRTSSPHITEAQQKLQLFIVKNDSALFTDRTALQRLHLPATALSTTR